MNRIHRLVWSQHHRQWLAVPETARRARAASDAGAAPASAPRPAARWRPLL
ncbi:MAG: ESPR domain-containing protein, partial [Burkholderiales bacterium]|nr:ESPR domain-containing protein [Burkholderiales bacterium]